MSITPSSTGSGFGHRGKLALGEEGEEPFGFFGDGGEDMTGGDFGHDAWDGAVAVGCCTETCGFGREAGCAGDG